MKNEKEDLEIQLLQEEMSVKILTREHILFWLHKFRGIDTTQRKQRIRLIDCFVNAVYIYDDGRAVVTFNYKDGAKVVSPTEIKESFGSTTGMITPYLQNVSG